jgi:hypothetical protein
VGGISSLPIWGGRWGQQFESCVGLLEKNIAAVAKRLSDVEAACNRETRGALPEIERNWYNLRAPEPNS